MLHDVLRFAVLAPSGNDALLEPGWNRECCETTFERMALDFSRRQQGGKHVSYSRAGNKGVNANKLESTDPSLEPPTAQTCGKVLQDIQCSGPTKTGPPAPPTRGGL